MIFSKGIQISGGGLSEIENGVTDLIGFNENDLLIADANGKTVSLPLADLFQDFETAIIAEVENDFLKKSFSENEILSVNGFDFQIDDVDQFSVFSNSFQSFSPNHLFSGLGSFESFANSHFFQSLGASLSVNSLGQIVLNGQVIGNSTASFSGLITANNGANINGNVTVNGNTQLNGNVNSPANITGQNITVGNSLNGSGKNINFTDANVDFTDANVIGLSGGGGGFESTTLNENVSINGNLANYSVDFIGLETFEVSADNLIRISTSDAVEINGSTNVDIGTSGDLNLFAGSNASYSAFQHFFSGSVNFSDDVYGSYLGFSSVSAGNLDASNVDFSGSNVDFTGATVTGLPTVFESQTLDQSVTIDAAFNRVRFTNLDRFDLVSETSSGLAGGIISFSSGFNSEIRIEDNGITHRGNIGFFNQSPKTRQTVAANTFTVSPTYDQTQVATIWNILQQIRSGLIQFGLFQN